MSINKLIVLGAAVILASFLGSMPVGAQVICDPADPTLDCDGDGILNGADLHPACNDLDPTLDCDADGVLNGADTCDNLDTSLDCDGDGVLVDACPYTDPGEDLVVGACTISGLDSILPEGSGPNAGCSLTELLGDGLDNCEAVAKNHGKYVSCVAHLTNSYKKAKLLTGAQKGQIQSCAAQSDIGKKPQNGNGKKPHP